MFLFNFLFGIIEMGGTLFLALYLWQDYRKGWIGVRTFAERGYHWVENLSFGMLGQSPAKSAQLASKNRAKRFAMLQASVAEVETVIQECREKAQENIQLMEKAEEVEMVAAEQGDQITLEAAAVEKLKHQRVAGLYVQTAEEFKGILPELHQNLAHAELDFHHAQAQVDTIRVEIAVTAVNQELYQLVSDVNATSGYTDKGEMGRLRDDVHHERIRSGKLLEIAQTQKSQHLRGVSEDKAVREEIESVLRRIASLPAPEAPENSHNGFTIVEENGRTVITPELVGECVTDGMELAQNIVH